MAHWYAEWRTKSRISRQPDPCPVCKGTGDFGEFRPPTSNHPNAVLQRRAEAHDAAREALIALLRLETYPELCENLGLTPSTEIQALREAMPDLEEELSGTPRIADS